MPWSPQVSEAARGLLEALLIGLLIGAQRETSQDERQAGLRDFVLIGLAGGVCGVLAQPWLTVAALLSIAGVLVAFHLKAGERTGITTELSAVATFCLAVLAAAPSGPAGARLAVGAAVVIVAFLEAKRTLHRFVRETITGTEFTDTIWFLALIFVIYPVLPDRTYGPYDAVNPRQIWLFVILVSSISFVGYFLQKFLGSRRGLIWTAVLGGLASTTATTLAFAREEKEESEDAGSHWYAVVLANAVQFPRVWILLYVVNPELSVAMIPPLLAAAVAGLLMGWALYRRTGVPAPRKQVTTGNPFRLAPALKFGAVFAAIMFASKAAAAEFGGQGLYWASGAGGTVDADAVTVSVASLYSGGSVDLATARAVLLLALFMNAVLKTGLAFYAGGAQFGRRTAAGFAVMFAPAILVAMLVG
ncbi:MAG TPA: MgtC/SapB family protein [Bryobacterales bacterium]|nr:MgtC/SapB family protein [Bryobacterales bacterium]